jgi:hypothetical protein
MMQEDAVGWDPAYVCFPDRPITSEQWIGCALLGWGITTTNLIYRACRSLLYARASGTVPFLSAVAQSAPLLMVALYVVLAFFLIRWYVVSRIAYLEEMVALRANR